MKRFTARDLEEWMASVKRFAPQYVSLDGDVVYLEVPPDRIIREIRGHVQKIPVDYRPASMLRELKEAGATRRTDSTPTKGTQGRKVVSKRHKKAR